MRNVTQGADQRLQAHSVQEEGAAVTAKKKQKIEPRVHASDIPVWCRHDEIKDVTELVPNPRNPNKHPDKQIALLAKIIRAQGWRQPITVSGRSGFVVKGHGRLEAAQLLNVENVPVELQDYSTEAEEYADMIADNRLAELAEPDDDMLGDLLGDPMFDGFDMGLTGFDDEALGDIMGEEGGNPGLTDPDDVPEDAPPVCQRGQIWRLGDHRLMCGDATNAADVAACCDGELVDMWLTDPPYNAAYEGKTKDALKIQNDSMEDAKFRLFLCDSYAAANENMKAGAVFYIWHADSEVYNFRGAAHDMGWQIRQCLIWKKQTLVMGRRDYHWKHEPCLYGWKGGAGHLWATDRKQTTILEFNRPTRSAEHPTMKPVDLFAYQMLNNTKGSDKILDSFGGSGTTIIACETHGRHGRALELDPKYCDVIIKRWEDFTGNKAELIEEATNG